MLFTGYGGQDLIVVGGARTQYVPVFFGGRGRRCPGPGPCPPKQPKKGPKLPPGMNIPKFPKVPKFPKIPIKIPKKKLSLGPGGGDGGGYPGDPYPGL